MWLVRIALTRPYTFVVIALFILISGLVSIKKMPTDIFPNVDIPVASVVWTYTNMPPEKMASYITTLFELYATTTVNNIERMESESLLGVSVTKIYFTKGSPISLAIAQLTAIGMTIIKWLPPGITPPFVLQYNASTVSLMRLLLSSDSLNEKKLFDYANFFVRPRLASVSGISVPPGYGGKVREIMVDLDSKALQQYSLSAQNVNAEIMKQNLILPAGTQKIGKYEYFIDTNNSPLSTDEFNHFPIKGESNTVIYANEIAHIRDGYIPQTNIVNLNGKRAVMLGVEKSANVSALDIIKNIQDLVPKIKESLDPALKYAITGNQAIFIVSAIQGVLVEGSIAACLTICMILLFLGSLRSTFIIVVSIPLSILVSISILNIMGESLNIMTLGGLALAVGILVDDATVTIENINFHLERGKSITDAIMLGAEQIAFPAIVSTISICIVFVPLFFLDGISKYLFVPMAEAVIFAMLASYFLSRTLVPTMAHYLLGHEDSHEQFLSQKVARLHHSFNNRFILLQDKYLNFLKNVLSNPKYYIKFFGLLLGFIGVFLYPFIGSDFFPKVDAGQILLHYSAPPGTRIEETAKIAGEVNRVIRKIIPNQEIDNIVDNIGLPIAGLNLTYMNSGTNGANDSDTYITLKSNHHSIYTYIPMLRKKLKETMPHVTFSFLPADMVNQILNFGNPSEINIQVSGLKVDENAHYIQLVLKKIKNIPGIVDARIRESHQYPSFQLNIDRTKAKELGFTQADIANNLFYSLTGGFQITPNFWIDPADRMSYPINVQTPQYQMSSLNDLLNMPVTNTNISTTPQILGAMTDIKRTYAPLVVSHYNVLPVLNIYASAEKRDLGSIYKDIQKVIDSLKTDLPESSQIKIRGQIDTKEQTFHDLYIGILEAIILVYFIMVINFQSWLYPSIIISGLCAVFAGVTTMLFFTGTTLSVPALTGTMMCIGVAISNGILMISFAKENLEQGLTPFDAAILAAKTRLRPILMTSLAMIMGMLPMSLGLGDGGEQNAPLGRAVIGGLLFALPTTLIFIPMVFNWILTRGRAND
jgi:multidrug efflux pump subunit AcrB